MTFENDELLPVGDLPEMEDSTLVLAFSGWMDGGDVSTGTVDRLIQLVEAKRFVAIDPEPFYIYNFPGSMEIAALFRPNIEIKDGLIQQIEMPENVFYHHGPARLVLFVGKEPNLRWRTFGDCILEVCRRVGVRRILFIGSFGGSVPHTRQPRMHITCSDQALLDEMQKYGARRSGYEGPGSFPSYLLTRAPDAGLQMTSLVAEIPGYLQGANPSSIEAVTRRLAKILQLPLDLDSLRAASTEWELNISSLIEDDEELAERVRQMEDDYDNELLASEEGEGIG